MTSRPGTSSLPPAAIVPESQTFGGSTLGVNPTAVDDSVNSFTGALETSHTDLRVAGIGVAFVLDRQYNSRNVSFSGAFGPGWSSILDVQLHFAQAGGIATVYAADGQRVAFSYNALNKVWERSVGVRASLTCSGPATNNTPPASCTVTRFADGSHWTFLGGYLKSYDAADGQGLTFDYDSSHRIDAVVVDTTASTPLVVHVTRDSSGRVTKLTTPTRSVSYTYDSAGDLSAVTDPAGNSWRMTYGTGHLLRTVGAYASATATTGTNVLSATYSSTTGRVSAVVQRNGAQMNNTTFGWTAGSAAGSGTATRNELVDVSGVVGRVTWTDTYANGTIVQREDPLGHSTYDTWNSDADLVQIKNALGATERMTYNASGDQLSDTQLLDRAGDTESSTYTYDARHRLISASKVITSSLTDSTTYRYNAENELVSTNGTGLGTSTSTYTSKGLLASTTDAAGDVTTYAYDAAGNLINQYVTEPGGVKPDGNGPLFAYDEAGDQVLSVTAAGNEGGGSYVAADATTTTYSPDGQETSVTTPSGTVTKTAYAPDGQTSSSTDAEGRTTTYTWSTVSLPGGVQGWQKTTVAPAGRTVDVYDPNGDVLSSTPPQPKKTVSGKPSGVVSDTYNAAAELIGRTNGQGVRTRYLIDAAGDVLETVSHGVTTTATYNLVGWSTGTSTTTLGYDPNQSSASGSSTSDTSTTATSYDDAGDVLSKTDPATGTTVYTYGPADRVATVSDAYGTTTYGYNAAGEKTSVTSPSGAITKYSYDALGHQTGQTIGAQQWTITYDVNGNPLQTHDPDGRIATYTYDASNRETSVTYSWASGHSGPRAPAVHFYYNKYGERMKMVDGQGVSLYSYDTSGRLATADQEGNEFEYDYSTPNQLNEVYPDGTTVTYNTDDAGNLLGLSTPYSGNYYLPFAITNSVANTMVTQGASNATTSGTSSGAVTPMPASGTQYPDGQFGYMFTSPGHTPGGTYPIFASGDAFYTDSMANSATASNADSPQAAYEAEADYNGNVLEELWNPLPEGCCDTSAVDEYYGYNGQATDTPVGEPGAISPAGSASAGVRLTSWNANYADDTGGYQDSGSYSYNADGEPTSINASNGPSGNAASVGWTLGYAGNGEINSVTTSAPDPSNTPGQSPRFGYDAAGDLTGADVEPQGQNMTQAGTQWRFTYNDAGQLAVATAAGATSGPSEVTYAYDGDGNLVSETGTTNGQAQTLSLTWDPRTPTPQLVEADETGGYHQRYFWGNGVAGLQEAVNGTVDYNLVTHDDQNGTPHMVTEANCGGCDPTLATVYRDPYGNYINGQSVGTVGHIGLLIGFDGSYTDPMTGLDLMGSRWYDPNLGMFMSRSAATPPAAGSSSMTSGADSTISSGMSDSPGTSPALPVTPAATNYSFAADDPTGEAEPTGNALVPATSGTGFAGTSGSDSLVSKLSVIKPFLGPLSALAVGAGKLAWKGAKSAVQSLKGWITQSPPAVEQAAAGTQEAAQGSTAAGDAALEAQAGNDAADVGKLGEDGAKAAKSSLGIMDYLGGAIDVAAVALSTYETVETCEQDSALMCAGAVTGEVVSYGVYFACEALTDGVASVGCGVAQAALAQIIPLIITGNGQALLDSVTFGSGYNMNDAQTLIGQYLIAGALGPIGQLAFDGEMIYANWSTIQSGLVSAGDAIESAFEQTGDIFVSGVEAGAGYVVSGISTAGEEIASGLSGLASEFSALSYSNLASEIESLGSNAVSVADSVGSSLCDFAQSVSCFFGSIFDRQIHEQIQHAAASPGRVPAGGASRSRNSRSARPSARVHSSAASGRRAPVASARSAAAAPRLRRAARSS